MGKRLVMGLAIMVGIGFLALAIYIISWIFLSSYFDHKNEAKIDKYFHEDIANLTDISVNSFKLWEGDSIVELTIKDKGQVMFFYGLDKVPKIMRIGNISVGIDCEKNGKLEYTSSVNLAENSPYKKLFPINVVTIRDLVENYDLILNVVKTLPDQVNDDPNYSWTEKSLLQNVRCGIHQ